MDNEKGYKRGTFWQCKSSPQYKGDVKMLESMQMMTTKLVRGLQGMPCEERLRTTGLPCLEKRRLRGDLTALCSSLGRGSWEICWVLFPGNRWQDGRGMKCISCGVSEWAIGAFIYLEGDQTSVWLPGVVIDVFCLSVLELSCWSSLI